jgi:energy-coupling factor transporter ATP-binding protein EcfA2
MASVTDAAVPHTDASSLERVLVDDLFGRFTYDLQLGPAPSVDLARLLVVYGDNGSGKTTILKLLFHLLSPGDRRGHRTFLATTPFRSFEARMSDGLVIRAERDGKNLSGSYILSLTRGQTQISEAAVTVNSRGAVTPVDDDNDPLATLTATLGDHLGADVYYIGDDRQLQSDTLPKERNEPGFITDVDPETGLPRILHVDARDRSVDLLLTIDRADAWIRERALGASTVGSESTNAVYANVVRTIASPTPYLAKQQPNLDAVSTRLRSLAIRNTEYQRFGLVPGLPVDQFMESMTAASGDSHPLIAAVLEPFLDGLEARLDALQFIQESLAAYVQSLNSFFADKQVAVTPNLGISISTSEGTLLPVGALSSGERQLLLLLTNMLFARDRRAIFIIDEPELSLNMKWQRKLVDALLDVTGSSGTQFVLASHSFELMSSARSRVVHLSQGTAERFSPE